MEQQKVVDRVKKLVNHAESAKEIGNEQEASAFTREAQRLLQENRLTMEQVEFEDELDEISEETFHPHRKGMISVGQVVWWQADLAGMIAEANGCDIILSEGSSSISFVGTDADRKVSIYVFERCARVIQKGVWDTLQELGEGDDGLVGATARVVMGCADESALDMREIYEDFGVSEDDISERQARYCSAGMQIEASDMLKNILGPYIHSYRAGFLSRLHKRIEGRVYAPDDISEEERERALVRLEQTKEAVEEYIQKKDVTEKTIDSDQRGFDAESFRKGNAAAEDVNLDANGMPSGREDEPSGLLE